MPAIEMRSVSRRFTVAVRAGRLRRRRVVVEAVRDLTLEVASGEIVGLCGPNGAGKSTTVKMLTGIVVPSGGVLRVLGHDPQRERVALARRIGLVMGQRHQLWWDLPVRDSFDLLRHIHRVPAPTHRRAVKDLVDVLDVGSLLDTPVRQLSLGQLMRCELIAAMLHEPELVILDEPTIGLDVVSKAHVLEFLAARNRDHGTTVVLTTHDMVDVERLCSRLAIIDHGGLVYDGPVDGLRNLVADERTVVVDLVHPLPALRIPGASAHRVEGCRQWITFERSTTNAAAVIAAVVDQAEVQDLTVEDPSIEDVVRRVFADGVTPRQVP